jgi:hypothetical protein
MGEGVREVDDTELVKQILIFEVQRTGKLLGPLVLKKSRVIDALNID